MTLWEIAAQWLRQHRRPRRMTWVTRWPQWHTAPRYNGVQWWAFRRIAAALVLLFLFRINPFGTLPLLLTIVGGTMALTEHLTHKRQRKSQFHTWRRKEHW